LRVQILENSTSQKWFLISRLSENTKLSLIEMSDLQIAGCCMELKGHGTDITFDVCVTVRH